MTRFLRSAKEAGGTRDIGFQRRRSKKRPRENAKRNPSGGIRERAARGKRQTVHQPVAAGVCNSSRLSCRSWRASPGTPGCWRPSCSPSYQLLPTVLENFIYITTVGGTARFEPPIAVITIISRPFSTLFEQQLQCDAVVATGVRANFFNDINTRVHILHTRILQTTGI